MRSAGLTKGWLSAATCPPGWCFLSPMLPSLRKWRVSLSLLLSCNLQVLLRRPTDGAVPRGRGRAFRGPALRPPLSPSPGAQARGEAWGALFPCPQPARALSYPGVSNSFLWGQDLCWCWQSSRHISELLCLRPAGSMTGWLSRALGGAPGWIQVPLGPCSPRSGRSDQSRTLATFPTSPSGGSSPGGLVCASGFPGGVCSVTWFLSVIREGL